MLVLSPQLISLLGLLSRLCGWIYTLAWSLSFYPQPLLNLRRRSTTGSSPSFPVLNVLGFAAYLASTTALYASSSVRAQYAARHAGQLPAVRGNDVAFAAHALLLSLLVGSMFWGGRQWWGIQGAKGRVEGWVKVVLMASVMGVLGTMMLVALRGTSEPTSWVALDVVYALGYAKLLITTVKYMPQVLSNMRRQSTSGWDIGQILLDFTGGVLSIAQLGIDSALAGGWDGLIGNPVKFGLGQVSIVFDLVFVIQHYYLYAGRDGKEALVDVEDGERTGLLG